MPSLSTYALMARYAIADFDMVYYQQLIFFYLLISERKKHLLLQIMPRMESNNITPANYC